MAAACGLGGLALLSGCATSGDPVAKAARATAARETARVTLSLSTRSLPLAESTGFGVVDFKGRLSRTRYPAFGENGRTWYAIGSGHVFYVSQPSGKWLRLDETKLHELYATPRDGSSLLIGRENALYDLLAALERGSRSVHVGAGSLSGLAVTHYRKAIATNHVPIDVWIGGNGLIRQLRAATAKDRRLGTIFTTWRFSGFGTSVRVTLPPPGAVTTTNGGR